MYKLTNWLSEKCLSQVLAALYTQAVMLESPMLSALTVDVIGMIQTMPKRREGFNHYMWCNTCDAMSADWFLSAHPNRC